MSLAIRGAQNLYTFRCAPCDIGDEATQTQPQPGFFTTNKAVHTLPAALRSAHAQRPSIDFNLVPFEISAYRKARTPLGRGALTEMSGTPACNGAEVQATD
jgi:hypothetical protein